MHVPSHCPTILQVLPALESGGVERGTIEMVEAITRGGGQALVASAGGRLAPMVERAGGRHVTLSIGRKSPLAVLSNTLHLKRLIRREKVDLVHARSRIPAWVAHRACKQTGTPFVTTWHGVHNATTRAKKFYNSVLAAGDRVIAISRFIAHRLRSEYDVPEDRLRVIPRGADIRQFDPSHVSGNRMQALLDSWGIEDDSVLILMPGRLTEWKGQGLLLDALALMTRERMTHTPWTCVFVGTAPERSDFPQILAAQARELSGRIRFGGHCADMPAALLLAGLVVVPSLRPEPFGRVVVEAQAMACPVIVAAHGAAMETVTHGETGILFRPGDAADLARMIAATLEASDDQCAAMGQRARDNVLAHYTTRNLQLTTLGVYDELLGTHMREQALASES
ncbi:glycosyltransferase family 4 protein [Acetobacter estunensis]|uniref:glycosyltransferase family 4 protein n=1 Tax=Acetobacter estunensis TaxID=104097 RepID=UPI001C2CCAFD|nr:glycosyltransferase family 4 protein [Acetobacter estunensis]MBV1837159.1 glycosyltransferase family 4 protein [Acetobacter estunensis]